MHFPLPFWCAYAGTLDILVGQQLPLPRPAQGALQWNSSLEALLQTSQIVSSWPGPPGVSRAGA